MNLLKKMMLESYEYLARFVGYKNLGRISALFYKYNKDSFFLESKHISQQPAIDKKLYTIGEYKRLINSHNISILNRDCNIEINKLCKRKIIVPGRCGVCGSAYGFILPIEAVKNGNFRESFGCVSCRRVRRERVILEKIKEYHSAGKKNIYILETGNNYKLIKRYAKNIIGSEYISADYKSGDLVRGVLHEDAHDLSFENESFDIVVSRDVFEHINDPHKCLKEAFRVLRWGGVVIISVPWNADTEKSIQRAKIEGGEIKYIEEPKYHWNPVSQKSDSLVFWDYGWDFIDFMRQTGFNNAYVQAYYDTSKGYLGDIGLYFIGEKKK